MALYDVNKKKELRLIFPKITEPVVENGKAVQDAEGRPVTRTVWEPSAGAPEIWGPGEIDGDIDLEVRSASDTVHVLPSGRMEETVDPTLFTYTLMYAWCRHPQTRWNLTTMVDTGRTDQSGRAVMEERSLELTTDHVNKHLHQFHRDWLRQELAREFYPDMFGRADPNSSPNGANGTSGPADGSDSGSSAKEPSPARHSPKAER